MWKQGKFGEGRGNSRLAYVRITRLICSGKPTTEKFRAWKFDLKLSKMKKLYDKIKPLFIAVWDLSEHSSKYGMKSELNNL